MTNCRHRCCAAPDAAPPRRATTRSRSPSVSMSARPDCRDAAPSSRQAEGRRRRTRPRSRPCRPGERFSVRRRRRRRDRCGSRSSRSAATTASSDAADSPSGRAGRRRRQTQLAGADGHEHRRPVAREPGMRAPGPPAHRGGGGLDDERDLVVRRRRLRRRVLQRDQPRQRLTDFAARRADGGERGAIFGLANQDVLEKDDRGRGARGIAGRCGFSTACSRALASSRPRRGSRGERGDGRAQRCRVAALRGETRRLDAGREVAGAGGQRGEQRLRLGLVAPALAFELRARGRTARSRSDGSSAIARRQWPIDAAMFPWRLSFSASRRTIGACVGASSYALARRGAASSVCCWRSSSRPRFAHAAGSSGASCVTRSSSLRACASWLVCSAASDT